MEKPDEIDLRVRADIERHGWHVVIVPPEGDSPGWAHTIGLFARYQHSELLVFGSPETFPEYSASLRRLAAGLPVRFLGGFGDGEAAEAYAQLDVLVVPSLWPENSPLVIHEAFLAGVAVVGARIGGIPELLRDGACGLRGALLGCGHQIS